MDGLISSTCDLRRLVAFTVILKVCFSAVIYYHALTVPLFQYDVILPCGEIGNYSGIFWTCSVSSVEDEKAIIGLVTGQSDTSHCIHSGLVDCENDKTKICIPVSMNYYICSCQDRTVNSSIDLIYSWSSEWTQMVQPQQGYYRQLCHSGTQECIAKESLLGFGYVILSLDLPESSFNASSTHNIHKPTNIKIDVELHKVNCAWAPKKAQVGEWIQIDLLEAYTVVGLFMKTKCAPHEHAYVTSLDLLVSSDSSVWTGLVDTLILDYKGQLNATYWLQRPLHYRYWRMYPLTWVNAIFPNVKADLIGRL